MAKYIVQKAVLPEKVQKKRQRSTEQYEAEFMCFDKLDGCCNVMRLDWTGEVANFSRTGERYVSLDGVARMFSYKYRREIKEFGGLVLIGEAWNPSLPFNVISGLYRRGEETDQLLMMVFDVLTTAEFDAGRSAVPYEERIGRLTSEGCGEDCIAYWPPGSFTIAGQLDKALSLGGRDGIILRDPKGTWTAGNGTTGEIVKVKQVLSFDLRVVDWEPGKGKHEGRMGSLIMDFGGKRLGVGTGFSDDFRHAVANDPGSFIGKIGEVEAMDYSSDGLLREPRFKGVRHDKLEPDAIAA